jgi:hypothetical protein
MVVVLERIAYGVTFLRGRTEEEWLVAPWWPCSGEANNRNCRHTHYRCRSLVRCVLLNAKEASELRRTPRVI